MKMKCTKITDFYDNSPELNQVESILDFIGHCHGRSPKPQNTYKTDYRELHTSIIILHF